MLLALTLACAPMSDGPQLLLTGWEYDWEALSHRISRLRVGVNPDSSLSLGLVGGDWSTGAAFTDVPHYRVRYQQVDGAGLDILYGTVAFLVGPDPEGSATLSFDSADIPEGRTLVAVLNGFSLDTGVPQSDDYPDDYDPAFGYTSMGFGFSLGEPTRSGSTVSVPVAATVRWAPQDRDDMNAAIPYAVTGVTVDVALLAVAGEVEVAKPRADASYDFDPPYTDQAPMTAAVDFTKGAREGIVAWRSFDLQANMTGPAAEEGDYLRAFGAELVPSEAAPRRWSGVVEATLSTTSALEFTQLTAGFEGEVIRVGLADVVAEHFVVSGEHPTGLATTGPTLPR